MTAVPAGWYQDPDDPATTRWWDGTAWTHETRPSQRSTVGPTAGWYGDPESPGRQRWWDGDGWAAPELLPESPAADVSPEPPFTEVGGGDAAAAEATAGVVLEPWVGTSHITAVGGGDDTDAPVLVASPGPEPRLQPSADAAPATLTAPPASHIVAPSAASGDGTEPLRSRPLPSRRTLITVAIALVGVVAVWLVYNAVTQARLSSPPETAAEKTWVAAGSTLGAQASPLGLTGEEAQRYCDGAFASLSGGPTPDDLAGVGDARAEKLFVSACLTAVSAPGSPAAPTPSSPSASS